MGGAVIGEKCIIGQNVFIGTRAKIGNSVKIQNNISIYECVEIEDNVFCGPSMVFTNVFNPRSEYPKDPDKEYLKTLVKRGATIGANSTIVCGNTIGEYAFIGAGAVVTKDIPDFALVTGNPSSIKGWMCKCGTKLDMRVDAGTQKTTCPECSLAYERNGTQVRCK